MILNEVQTNIYELVNKNARIRSDKLSRLLNQSQERIRKEISTMVLNEVIDGRLNNGYVINQEDGGLIKRLGDVALIDLLDRPIIIDNPTITDLMFYQTMSPVNFIVKTKDNKFDSIIYFDGENNTCNVSINNSLTSLDFSLTDIYAVLDEYKQVLGCITKTRYEDYFVNLLKGDK